VISSSGSGTRSTVTRRIGSSLRTAIEPAGNGVSSPFGYKALQLARELLGGDAISAEDWKNLRFDLRTNTSGQLALVVFHPSYNYEDFVRGIQVETNNGQVEYNTVNKVFCEIALQAGKNEDKTHVLVIDEIDRANLPAVMGELLFALEYRDWEVNLPYAREALKVPKNLHIIGTMNTADRSIGYLDYAVRRRFAFIPCEPSQEKLESYYGDEELKTAAVSIFRSVSALFSPDTQGNPSKYLSPDFDPRDVAIGHTYFMAKDGPELVRKAVFQVLPLLREYIRDGILKPEEEKFAFNIGAGSINLLSPGAQQEFGGALWQMLPR
jgi:5-methylcytosine-specific restriction endonuclease McrBC GTP-binding regulatory subunit McrB